MSRASPAEHRGRSGGVVSARPPADHHGRPEAGPDTRPNERDRGTGLIGTLAGVTVFLVFLLFAVQLLVDLYATSTATSAAFDGARVVAGSRADHADPLALVVARTAAERRVRSELGDFGRTVRLDWAGSDADTVQLRIVGEAPRFLFPSLQRALGVDHIDRTVRVRVESFR
jgi:hypothetical protein